MHFFFLISYGLGVFETDNLPCKVVVCVHSTISTCGWDYWVLVWSPVWFQDSWFLFFGLLQNDWVICRVFQKTTGGKKIHISGLVRGNSDENETGNSHSLLPPLTDSSPSHVHCFSNYVTAQKNQESNMINSFNTCPNFSILSNSNDIFQRNSLPNAFTWNQTVPLQHNFPQPGSFPLQDPATLRNLLENYGQQSFKKETDIISASQETGISTDMNTEITSAQQDLDCFWTYWNSWQKKRAK